MIGGVPERSQQQIVAMHFARCLRQQWALTRGGDEHVHAFRLACKNLRFALERLDPPQEDLEPARSLLELLCDELGYAHDCTRLAQLAQERRAPLTAARGRRDRDGYVARARALWRTAFRDHGEFEQLAGYALFRWDLA